MFSRVYDLLGILTTVVQVLLLAFLLKSSLRKSIVLTVYVLLDLANNTILTLFDFLYGGSSHVSLASSSEAQRMYTHLYWTGEVILDLVLFLLVIELTYHATEGGPLRAAAGKILTLVVIVVSLLPFVLFHPKFSPWPNGFWFNSTSQLLNFGGAIMNLALWTALIASKRRDPELLTVSAGMGIAVTGAAISFGLRHFISLSGPRWIPDLFLLLTHLTGLIIWCWAFRPAAKPRQVPSDAVTSH
jgi:hypothetical protein